MILAKLVPFQPVLSARAQSMFDSRTISAQDVKQIIANCSETNNTTEADVDRLLELARNYRQVGLKVDRPDLMRDILETLSQHIKGTSGLHFSTKPFIYSAIYEVITGTQTEDLNETNLTNTAVALIDQQTHITTSRGRDSEKQIVAYLFTLQAVFRGLARINIHAIKKASEDKTIGTKQLFYEAIKAVELSENYQANYLVAILTQEILHLNSDESKLSLALRKSFSACIGTAKLAMVIYSGELDLSFVDDYRILDLAQNPLPESSAIGINLLKDLNTFEATLNPKRNRAVLITNWKKERSIPTDLSQLPKRQPKPVPLDENTISITIDTIPAKPSEQNTIRTIHSPGDLDGKFAELNLKIDDIKGQMNAIQAALEEDLKRSDEQLYCPHLRNKVN